MTSPRTSIVIRTFNEEKRLPALLDALDRQSDRDYETVIVDSGSIDRTRDIAAGRADKLVRIDSHDFTFGYSLNRGIQSSAGQFVVIVSAHTLPRDADWLARLIDPLTDSQTAAVFGRQLGHAQAKFSESEDLRRAFGGRRKLIRPPDFGGNNANAAIRRDLWAQRPFDESLPGLEDIDWAKHWIAQGYQVVYEPQAALYHFHEESWPQVRKRYYREALAGKWIGLRGRRDVWIEPLREFAYATLDIGRILLTPPPERSARAEGWTRRVREILMFRANKSIGTVQGLLDGEVMQNPKSREHMFYNRTCPAVVVRGAGRARLEEIQVPNVDPGDVLIRVAYEGVCATDLEIVDGTLGYYKSGMAAYPIVPGHEFSGVVAATGTNVHHLKEGQPVVVECIQSCGACADCRRANPIGCGKRSELGVIGLNGGYAGYVVVPARFVHPLPTDMDIRRGCLAEPLAVVLKGIKRLMRCWPAQPAVKRCVVLGAGTIGHLCARVLARHGHQVTVVDPRPNRTACFAGGEISVLPDLTGRREFDVAIEATGNPTALDRIMAESPAGSTLLLLGLPYDSRPFNFEQVVAFDKIVVGSVGSGPEDFDEAIRLLPNLDLDAFFQCVLPLERFRDAWDIARRGESLKVILEISPGGSQANP